MFMGQMGHHISGVTCGEKCRAYVQILIFILVLFNFLEFIQFSLLFTFNILVLAFSKLHNLSKL